MAQLTAVQKIRKNAVNEDLKELYLQLNLAHDLLDAYLSDCTEVVYITVT